MKVNLKSCFYILLFSLAIFLRIYNYGSYPLGFDQIQILENAEQIKESNLTLIGPRTGSAQIFTGPLIYYFTSLLLLIIPSPYAVFLTALLFSLLTGLGILYLTNLFLKKEITLLILVLWAVSPFIVFLDRVSWNPNLSILAAALVFFSCFLAFSKKKISWREILLVSIGSWLGYQAHFSGFLLPILVLFSELFFRNFRFKLFFASLVGIIIGLIPTLIFDLRHDWLNTKGLFRLLGDGNKINIIHWISEAIDSSRISLENIGKILFLNNNYIFIIFLGTLIIIYYIYLAWRNNKKSKIHFFPLFWIFSIAIFFGFYRENKPEYYFLIQIPAILFILGQIFSSFLKTKKEILFITIIIFTYTFLLLKNRDKASSLELKNQLRVVKSIQELAQEGKIKSIVYDMNQADTAGLKYLLKKQKLQLNSSGYDIHIAFPHLPSTLSTQTFGNVSIWIDPRIDNEKNYLSTDKYIIETPQNIKLYQSYYQTELFNGNQVYLIFEDQKQIGRLIAISIRNIEDINLYKELGSLIEKKQKSKQAWTFIKRNPYTGYGHIKRNIIFVYLPDDYQSENNIYKLLSTFSIY